MLYFQNLYVHIILPQNLTLPGHVLMNNPHSTQIKTTGSEVTCTWAQIPDSPLELEAVISLVLA